jgi:peptide/nickel transport system permease protein
VLRYLLKRALSSLVALFLFVTFMFFAVEILIPNDFTVQYAQDLNQAQREKIKQALGIDLPLGQRYLHWIRNLLSGDLGTSFYGGPVAETLRALLPYTLLIFFTGTIIAFQLGLWLGKVTGWRGPGLLSSSMTLGAISLYTAFPPWLAFLVVYFFARRFRLLAIIAHVLDFTPSSNLSRGLNPYIWSTRALDVPQVMFYVSVTLVGAALVLAAANWGLGHTVRRRLPDLLNLFLLITIWIGSWYTLGFGPQALDIAFHASVPVLTYVLLSFGEKMLIMRASMTDTLHEDYVVTARAKGLPDPVVRDRHVARTALLPVFSKLIVSLPYLLTGLVIVETALAWPGISSAMFGSFYQQDMPVVMGGLFLIGVLCAVARLVLDVVYAYLDPRIRYGADPSWRLA